MTTAADLLNTPVGDLVDLRTVECQTTSCPLHGRRWQIHLYQVSEAGLLEVLPAKVCIGCECQPVILPLPHVYRYENARRSICPPPSRRRAFLTWLSHWHSW